MHNNPLTGVWSVTNIKYLHFYSHDVWHFSFYPTADNKSLSLSRSLSLSLSLSLQVSLSYSSLQHYRLAIRVHDFSMSFCTVILYSYAAQVYNFLHIL